MKPAVAFTAFFLPAAMALPHLRYRADPEDTTDVTEPEIPDGDVAVVPDTENPDSDLENPDTEVPDTEVPDTEDPDTEEPDTEEPDTEEPDTEEPDTEEPDTEEPDTEEPDTEEPDTEEPDTEEPDTEEPDTEEPDTEEPDTEEPDTEEPDTEEPDTEEPDTEEPDTEEPDTEEPDTDIPTPDDNAICIPARYQCHYNTAAGIWGWQVCDVSSHWVNGGSCSPDEVCIFNSLNGSPYCVPSGSSTPDGNNGNNNNGNNGNNGNSECTDGQYQCVNSPSANSLINVCEGGKWVQKVTCEADETCTYGAVHGYPYCAPKTDAKVCTPGTYQCAYNAGESLWGWEVCTVEGKWVTGGYCGDTQTCSFNTLNGSPYCI